MLAVSASLILRANILTDMSVFLPASPNTEQKLLIANLQRGQTSRTLLASVGPVSPQAQRDLSQKLATAWRSIDGISIVSNGDLNDFSTERDLLFERRYLLSDVSETFQDEALQQSLSRARALLASSAGLFNKSMILSDPTGAGLAALESLAGSGGPKRHAGVWVSPDGQALLFVLNLASDGADLDTQERVINEVEAAFGGVQIPSGATLTLTGAPTFAVQSRNEIRGDVILLSGVGIALIITLLIGMFRSLPALLVALVPLGTAVLIGAAATALSFGSLHALTLGFGVALIGECVDYALYHLVGRQSSEQQQARFWSPIRLGLLTSLTGFTALLISDFPGLAQLSMFAMAGLTAGFLTTRWVLPLIPLGRGRHDSFVRMEAWLQGARVTIGKGWPVALVTVLACLVIAVLNRGTLWSTDIAALNPVSAQAQAVDTVMREALGGPDVNNLVIVRVNEAGEDVLSATAAVARALDSLVLTGQLRGYQSVTSLVPPLSEQRARQASLPEPDALQKQIARLSETTGLSVKALATFANDVEQARNRQLITPADYDGTRLGATVQTLLTEVDQRATAIIPLTLDVDRPVDASQVQALLDQALATDPALETARVTVLNMKARTDELYAQYISDAVKLSLAGAIAIAALLLIALRSFKSLVRVMVPIAGALIIIVAGFAMSGHVMHLLHLVGLLLVAAIGSNYALVLTQADSARSANGETTEKPLTLAPLVLANLTTLAGFGVLAFSSIPLLAALGMTVGVGAPLVLLLSIMSSAVA
ncbi:MAG: MMPL family transporter [Burkholderiaceae bacterium]